MRKMSLKTRLLSIFWYPLVRLALLNRNQRIDWVFKILETKVLTGKRNLLWGKMGKEASKAWLEKDPLLKRTHDFYLLCDYFFTNGSYGKKSFEKKVFNKKMNRQVRRRIRNPHKTKS